MFLSKSANLIRDIRGLDKKFTRETAKIALIYVAHGQEDESAIFRNKTASKTYTDFVAALGWPVHLSTHYGYKGGLETNMMNDGIASYFCTSTQEVIFHDIVGMVTDPNDPKQLKKKRHIGNDHVHIVWNEHATTKYKNDTIGGDFGNAQIVITPLTSGWYKIDVYRDSGGHVLPFGILRSGAIVPQLALAPLVRFTALSAYRNAITAGSEFSILSHPYEGRKEAIEIIASRHGLGTRTFEAYMNQIMTEPAKETIGVA